MRERAMKRIERILEAQKLAELARLGAIQAAAGRERDLAARLRGRSRGHPASGAVADMLLTCEWQQSAERRARAGEDAARAIEEHAPEVRAALARTIGRQSVISRLIKRQQKAARQLAERRAEG